MRINIKRCMTMLTGAVFCALPLALGAALSASAAGLSYDEVDHGYTDSYALDAYAQAATVYRPRNGASVPVYGPDGSIIGRDPDINVRKQLQDDYWIGKY